MTHVHLIGIGGSGMSAIARLLVESNVNVSGSDRLNSPIMDELTNVGVHVYLGHAAANVQGATLVIRSSAILDDNPEVQAAQLAGIPVIKRAQFLGQWMEDRTGIAIAGTHGKTTTTAMITWILVNLGLDPSYIIGGISKNLNTNAHAGKGDEFIVEADEYDRMFLGLSPIFEVITNVEYDHPDCYLTPEEYYLAFVEFVHRLKPGGVLVCCADDVHAFKLANMIPSGCKSFTYGVQVAADYMAIGIQTNTRAGVDFIVQFQDSPLAQVSLQVPGMHNVLNALASLATTHQLGLAIDKAANILASFNSTRRRFELFAEVNEVTIINDYAHHPTEIRATLAAVKLHYAGHRIWAVWQPHTYSRTQTLLNEFATSFQDADRVIVTEIFAAREHSLPFSSAQIVSQMNHAGAEFIASLQDTSVYLLDHLQSGDVLLVLSAGDADQISTWVAEGLVKSQGGPNEEKSDA
jgi:UDP-N-acetylmuramate--alanine ligase